MEKNYTEKEEFKTILSNKTESNLQETPYKTQTSQFKNRLFDNKGRNKLSTSSVYPS